MNEVCRFCNSNASYDVRSLTTANSSHLETCGRHLARAIHFFVMVGGETVVKRLK